MAQAARTFRIFVSSTFADLKEERNALQARVFPKLRELCARHGCRFQAIDLRWGVSDEAGLDQRTTRICLEEIARCQEVSPRPNFIVLLGQRYGWRPLPYEIPADEFKRIHARVSESRQKTLEDWYHLDENARQLVYFLRTRRAGVEEERSYDRWTKTERELRAILLGGLRGERLEGDKRLRFIASATEQEIEAGALDPKVVERARQHVFCLFRTIKGELPDGFTDLVEGKQDPEAAELRQELEARLRSELPDENILRKEVEWDNPATREEYLGELCDGVEKWLSAIITREVEQLKPAGDLEKENGDHEKFGAKRAEFFTGRDEVLRSIKEYVEGDEPHPLAIHGEGGTGKTALMAHAAGKIGKPVEVIQRYVGATPGSSDGRALLDNLCREIGRRYGAAEPPPVDYQKLVEEFRKRLEFATDEKRLVMFLDALDQLSDAEGARSLVWLPADLPANVRIVVSCLSGDVQTILEPKATMLALGPMSEGEGAQLLDVRLKHAGRTLQEPQGAEVLRKFKGEPKPLYLKLAFEEARQWRSGDDVAPLASDIPGIIRQMFERLSLDANHGSTMLSRSLGYLAAAKNGLTEDEMLDVLARDVDVWVSFFQRARHVPSDWLPYLEPYLRPGCPERALEAWLERSCRPEAEADLRRVVQAIMAKVRDAKAPGLRLPVVVWSRLQFDLEPYLAERSADGTILMTFYHRQLAGVAAEDFLKGGDKRERHRALAGYFGEQKLEIEKVGEKAEKTPNTRKMSELPYQQTYGGMWRELEGTLTDLGFVQAKCVVGQAFDLVEDYRRALAAWPGFEPYDPFKRAAACVPEPIRRSVEAVIAGRTPPPVPDECLRELAAVSSERALEEIKRTAALEEQEREGGAGHEREWSAPERVEIFSRFVAGHIHTLRAYPEEVIAVAYNHATGGPVARAADAMLPEEPHSSRMWLERVHRPGFVERPACLRTLEGHTHWVNTVALSADSRIAISGSVDKTVRVWDAGSGRCLRTLEGHTHWVKTAALSADSRLAVSGGFDKTVRVWDVGSGRCLRTLEGHASQVFAVALSADSRIAVSGSVDKTVRVWEVGSGRCLRTLEGHKDKVYAVALSADSRLAVSGSDDKTVRVWDVGSGRCLRTFDGHTDSVNAVALSADSRLAVSGSGDKTVRVWDVGSGRCLRTLEGHKDKVYAVALSADSRLVVSGSHDKTVRVWDVGSGRCPRTLEGHAGPACAVALSAGSRLAVSAGSLDKTVRVWDLASGRCLGTLEGHTNWVAGIALSADSRLVVSGGFDNTVRVWDVSSGRCLRTLEGHTDSVTALALSIDSRLAVSGSGDKTVRVWDVGSGRCLRTLEGHKDEVYAVALSADSRLTVSGSEDKTVRVWDVASGRCLRTVKGHTDRVAGIALSADSRVAISGSWDNTVRVWDVASGRCLRTLEGHTKWVAAIGLSADSRVAVSGGGDRTVRVWDVASGRCLRTLEGHTDKVSAVALSADSRVAVSGGGDRTVRVWDVASGRCLAVYAAFAGVHSLDLAGGRVVAGDEAGQLHFLALRNFELGPPILTAIRRGGKLRLTCPHCQRGLVVREKALGKTAKTACCQKPAVLAPTFCDADAPLPEPE